MFDTQRLAFAAADFAAEHARWPRPDELLARDATLPQRDIWKHAFRFVAGEQQLVVQSAGIDGTFDTCDDVSSDPMRMTIATATEDGPSSLHR